jgi:hypothetical protein
LGEVLSDCGTPAAGIVDADALLASEKPSPAVPNTLTAVDFVVRFCLEACLTRAMVASSKCLVKMLSGASVRSASAARKGWLGNRRKICYRIPVHLDERDRPASAAATVTPASRRSIERRPAGSRINLRRHHQA